MYYSFSFKNAIKHTVDGYHAYRLFKGWLHKSNTFQHALQDVETPAPLFLGILVQIIPLSKMIPAMKSTQQASALRKRMIHRGASLPFTLLLMVQQDMEADVVILQKSIELQAPTNFM